MANHLLRCIQTNPVVDRYIDLNIIDEFADKSGVDGYSLNVYDIPEHDLANLIDIMFKQDCTIKDVILEHVQTLIDIRLDEVESNSRFERKYA